MNPLRRALLAWTVIMAASASPGALAARPLVIGYAQAKADPDCDSACHNARNASIQAAAARGGITLKQAPPQQSQEAQIRVIRTFIAGKVDLIAITPAAQTGWEPVLREAKAAGIPLIVIGSAIGVDQLDLYAAFIGADYAEEGRRAGHWLARHAAMTPGAVFNIVELRTVAGSPATNARSAGFAQAVAGHARIHIVRHASDKAALLALLQARRRDINMVYAHSGDMTRFAIEAIEEAGLRLGHDIQLVSIGANSAAMEAITADKLTVRVESASLLGPLMMQVARDLLAGKRVPKWVSSTSAVPAIITRK